MFGLAHTRRCSGRREPQEAIHLELSKRLLPVSIAADGVRLGVITTPDPTGKRHDQHKGAGRAPQRSTTLVVSFVSPGGASSSVARGFELRSGEGDTLAFNL